MEGSREDIIYENLKKKRRVQVAELVESLGVSEVTIRKDLANLERRGIAFRTRGGAVLARAVAVKKALTERETERIEAKEAIAEAAVQLLGDGSTAFIDSGSTCAILADFIALRMGGRGLSIVSHSLPVIERFASEQGFSLYALGGAYRPESGCFSDPSTIEALRRYSTDVAFVGTTGFDEAGNCSAQNAMEAEVKRTALALSHRRVLLMDSTKAGARAFSIFADKAGIDLIVTDADIADETLAGMRDLGLDVLVAGRRQAARAGGD
jgi:DeoR/GlpR family transcriptional regulator of sugar metabolism